jgi:hypothetical protein
MVDRSRSARSASRAGKLTDVGAGDESPYNNTGKILPVASLNALLVARRRVRIDALAALAARATIGEKDPVLT